MEREMGDGGDLIKLLELCIDGLLLLVDKEWENIYWENI